MPRMSHTPLLFYSINKVGAIANMILISTQKEIEYAVDLTDSKYLITTNFLYKNVGCKGSMGIKKLICKNGVSKPADESRLLVAGGKIPKINMEEDEKLIYWKISSPW